MRVLHRLWPILALCLLVSAVLIWRSWDVIITRAGWDPDDQLRLVQLRDFLGGQSWFDTTQYRLNPPDGAPMHWSRLIELPLALVVVLVTPLLDAERAEMAAGIIVPLFCLGGITFLLADLAEKIGGPSAGVAAAILTLISPGLLLQLQPMRIDHHGWQIFCAVLALSALFWANARKAGLIMGAALSIWLHISLEGAPMTAAFFAVLGWRWINNSSEAPRMFSTLCSFAGASLALFLGTQATGFAAQQYCDTISPAHIWAIFAAVAILIVAVKAKLPHAWQRAVAVVTAGAATIGVLLWFAPFCAQGAFADLDPVVREFWYANVKEGLPVWYQDPIAVITLLPTLAVALIGLPFAFRTADASHRPILLELGFILIYASVLSLLVFRTVSVATAFTVVPTALCIAAAIRLYRTEPKFARRMALVIFALILLVPGTITATIAKPFNSEEKADAKPSNIRKAAGENCEAVSSIKALSRLPTGNILAPFDLGPAILLTTPHKVLASSHHRNRQGMRDHIDIFRLPPAQARPIMQRHHIAYLVACLGEAELKHYVRKSPTGLWAQIDAGNPPDWLEYQGVIGKGLKVWRVR